MKMICEPSVMSMKLLAVTTLSMQGGKPSFLMPNVNFEATISGYLPCNQPTRLTIFIVSCKYIKRKNLDKVVRNPYML
jgi:hypothetical protein